VAAARDRPSQHEIAVATDLPHVLPTLRVEMAILRAFLVRDIDHILFEEATP
jgi:hypothetical protein